MVELRCMEIGTDGATAMIPLNTVIDVGLTAVIAIILTKIASNTSWDLTRKEEESFC